MAEFLVFVSVVAGIFQIILFFKIWSMTNDVKELKNHIINKNNSSTQSNPSSKESKKETDNVINLNDIKEGNVVYGKKDNKKYTVVKVLSNGKLRLDDGSNKPQYDELPIEDVVL